MPSPFYRTCLTAQPLAKALGSQARVVVNPDIFENGGVYIAGKVTLYPYSFCPHLRATAPSMLSDSRQCCQNSPPTFNFPAFSRRTRTAMPSATALVSA